MGNTIPPVAASTAATGSAAVGGHRSSNVPSTSFGESPTAAGTAPPTATPQHPTLCIRSNVADGQVIGGAEPGLTAGHANLSLHTSDGQVTTYGTWPDAHPDIQYLGLDYGPGSDVRVDFGGDDPSNYPHAYCEELSPTELKTFQEVVAQRNEWGYLNNCSSFAGETFEAVTGTRVSADDYFGIDTPRALGDSIREALATE